MCPTGPGGDTEIRSPAGDFVVEARADGTAIRPTRSLLPIHGLLMCLIGVYCLALIVDALSVDGIGLGGVITLIVLVPFGLLGVILHVWLGRGSALVVEADGRVTYGRTELGPANTVVLVVLTELRHLRSKRFNLDLLRRDGSTIRLPGPYFAELTEATSATWLATHLARLLQVPVETRSATGSVTHESHSE